MMERTLISLKLSTGTTPHQIEIKTLEISPASLTWARIEAPPPGKILWKINRFVIKMGWTKSIWMRGKLDVKTEEFSTDLIVQNNSLVDFWLLNFDFWLWTFELT